MRNKYEFNIEDIISCTVVSPYDEQQLTVGYVRIEDENGNNTRNFVTKYYAHQDTISQEGMIGTICNRCGAWTFCEEDSSDNTCKHCESDYKETYTEEEMIDLILSYVEDEELFRDVNLFINDIEII